MLLLLEGQFVKLKMPWRYLIIRKHKKKTFRTIWNVKLPLLLSNIKELMCRTLFRNSHSLKSALTVKQQHYEIFPDILLGNGHNECEIALVVGNMPRRNGDHKSSGLRIWTFRDKEPVFRYGYGGHRAGRCNLFF